MRLFKQLIDWVDVRIGVREVVEKELTGYLLPRNINVWYSMGSVLLFCFALQVVTGMLLLIYYVPDADKAFKSVTFIMNDVPYGWLIRMCHAVGSNMMVLVLLLHMLSVLFMGSYKSPREFNWLTGFMLFTLVQGISLTGYLLPWSQLSFWATTVATNSVAAIPLAGSFLGEFLGASRLVGPRPLGRGPGIGHLADRFHVVEPEQRQPGRRAIPEPVERPAGRPAGRTTPLGALLCTARGTYPGRDSRSDRRAPVFPEACRRLHAALWVEGDRQSMERRYIPL